MTPHWVYIFRNRAGVALYVGCTSRLPQRLSAHAADKSWYGEVASVSADMHHDQATAEAAELALIRSLRPLYERSSVMRSHRGERAALPCRTCHRGNHGACIGANSRGEPCPCKVCTRPLIMGSAVAS